MAQELDDIIALREPASLRIVPCSDSGFYCAPESLLFQGDEYIMWHPPIQHLLHPGWKPHNLDRASWCRTCVEAKILILEGYGFHLGLAALSDALHARQDGHRIPLATAAECFDKLTLYESYHEPPMVVTYSV